MEHLNRVAVPVSALGLILLLFAVIWREGVQLAVAAVLLAIAAAIWWTVTGTWPLGAGSP